MAKLEVVIVEDGEAYYLSDGSGEETGECVGWGEVLEFNGERYVADCDEDGDTITLAKLVDMPAGAYEAVSEDSDEEETESEEVETE